MNDWYEQYERNAAGARADAMRSLEEMQLPMRLELPSTITGLHERANSQYANKLAQLGNDGEDIENLLAYSQWVLWLSCWEGAHWTRRSIETGLISNNDVMLSRCTPSGYAKSEGWSNTVYEKMSENSFEQQFSPVLSIFRYKKSPEIVEVLTALQVHWLHKASRKDISHSEFLEAIHEASDAGLLGHGSYMWNECEKFYAESSNSSFDSPAASAARKALARNAASARHAENRAMKQQVFEWCDANVGNFSSLDAGASAVAGVLVPVAWRTARDWMTEWKKLRAAGTA
ncbi:hypothetical protein [Acidovorax sp. PRC11]|uniref:hypothetical protein n=1 Tax=Acidovorax sp. PRC11 TaxID=2962592 RepID=UPI00288230AD|nr:hypothetical protein [Acidovorax sp. PRC11]MDT0137746.1 hypothetical protein [Acidovorax sp. PRC11]